MNEINDMEREQRDLRHIAVENANDAIYVITPDGFEFVNPAFRELTGYSEDEVTAEDFDFWELLHPDDHDFIRQREQARERGEDIPSRYEFRIVDKQGDVKTVEATTVDIGTAGEPRVMGILRDITDRVRMEEALQESESRFRDIFEHSMMGIYKTTPDGRILMANPALVDMLGYDSFEELAQRNLEQEGFSPSYERDQFKQAIEGNGIVRGLESTWTRKDGTTLYVRENAKAIYDDSGGIQYYLGTVEDITDRIEAEQRTAELNDLLHLTNKIMRHDVLNDVQVARSALDLYHDEQDEELLDKLASRLEQSASLINRMGELETLMAAGKPLEPYQVKEIVEEIAGDYDVDVSVNGDCMVQADAAFPSVIDNLVENAVVHGEADHIEISMEKRDGRCIVRIADDGTGIPDKVKERVFKERFSHGSHAGTGLGLYIVRKVVERYGGSIAIEDNKPSGTVVVIELDKAVT